MTERLLFRQPVRMLASNNIRQVVYSVVPLSPRSITWCQCKNYKSSVRLYQRGNHIRSVI